MYPNIEPSEGTQGIWQPQVDCPDAYRRVMEDQAVYTECLSAVTSIFIKHRRFINAGDIRAIMEAIIEPLYAESEREIKELAEQQYDISSYPEGHKKLCEGSAEKMVDNLRVKQIDWNKAFNECFRPVGAGE